MGAPGSCLTTAKRTHVRISNDRDRSRAVQGAKRLAHFLARCNFRCDFARVSAQKTVHANTLSSIFLIINRSAGQSRRAGVSSALRHRGLPRVSKKTVLTMRENPRYSGRVIASPIRLPRRAAVRHRSSGRESTLAGRRARIELARYFPLSVVGCRCRSVRPCEASGVLTRPCSIRCARPPS